MLLLLIISELTLLVVSLENFWIFLKASVSLEIDTPTSEKFILFKDESILLGESMT